MDDDLTKEEIEASFKSGLDGLRARLRRFGELHSIRQMSKEQQQATAADILERDFPNDEFMLAVAELLRGRKIKASVVRDGKEIKVQSEKEIQLALAYERAIKCNDRKKHRRLTRDEVKRRVAQKHNVQLSTVANAHSKYFKANRWFIDRFTQKNKKN